MPNRSASAPVSRMSVVVVSFNTQELLRNCLQSVVAASASEIIVVDDGSTDGSVEMVRRDFPRATVLQTPSNVGYGASANAGMAACSSDYCLLLNADTVIPPDALTQLAAYLDAHPTAGVVGPRLVNPDGSLQRSIHQFPSTLVTLLDYSWLGLWLGKIPLLRKAYLASDSHERPRIVDWVTGAALAFRQPAYNAVGGFDRRFFMYYEEVDLSYRLHQAGWETHFTPVVNVIHIGGASTSPQRHAMYVQQLVSGIQFFTQHYSPSAARRGRWAFATAMRANLLGDLLRSRFDRDPESAAAAHRRLPEWRAVLRDLGEAAARRHCDQP